MRLLVWDFVFFVQLHITFFTTKVSIRNLACDHYCKSAKTFIKGVWKYHEPVVVQLEMVWDMALPRQITPPTKNGHAPPPTKSRKSYQSVNPTSVRAWWDFPCWVKLSHRLHSWWCPSVNYFKFQLCNHTSPGTHKLWFPGSSLPSQKIKRRQIASWHRLWLELGRYLIAFEPLTFVLD